ncbi:hypothetical protein CDAR_26851 [Caerostris darwini]|uniref:Uncharacterized protein n=1 Tax=Caerostris darwini TaxID=1538125 RepID=A0AAV4WWE8_9ARAC|nr:hypothetical protein CDAR_26851 [Caerostris darwini]
MGTTYEGNTCNTSRRVFRATEETQKTKKEVDFLNSAKTTIQISTGILFIRQALRERVADKGMQGFPGTLPIPVVGHLIYGPERMLKSTTISIVERMVVIVRFCFVWTLFWRMDFLKLSGGFIVLVDANRIK